MKNLLFCVLLSVLIISCSKDESLAPEINVKQDQTSILKGNNGNNGSNGNKVDVCHNGHVINVNVNSLPAHQAHGDAVDMDGDGYFDMDNDCGPTDCDDSNADLNETCGECCLEELLSDPNTLITKVTRLGETFYYMYNPNTREWGLLDNPSSSRCGITDYVCYTYTTPSCPEYLQSTVTEADYNACLDIILDRLQNGGNSIDQTNVLEEFSINFIQEDDFLHVPNDVK